MKAYIISDKDEQTPMFDQLSQLVRSYLTARNFEIEEVQIGRADLTFCMGCFGCWVKKPGECVINDKISQINRTLINSDVAIYLCPVIFGQFSANIKNSIDRFLPNALPFFITRPDGSTIHPSRYSSYPKQIMIGYDEELSLDDAQLFTDITKKHRTNIEVLIYRGNESDITGALDQIDLKRVGGQL
jgi:multimeric flavodoxin WrbA